MTWEQYKHQLALMEAWIDFMDRIVELAAKPASHTDKDGQTWFSFLVNVKYYIRLSWYNHCKELTPQAIIEREAFAAGELNEAEVGIPEMPPLSPEVQALVDAGKAMVWP